MLRSVWASARECPPSAARGSAAHRERRTLSLLCCWLHLLRPASARPLSAAAAAVHPVAAATPPCALAAGAVTGALPHLCSRLPGADRAGGERRGAAADGRAAAAIPGRRRGRLLAAGSGGRQGCGRVAARRPSGGVWASRVPQALSGRRLFLGPQMRMAHRPLDAAKLAPSWRRCFSPRPDPVNPLPGHRSSETSPASRPPRAWPPRAPRRRCARAASPSGCAAPPTTCWRSTCSSRGRWLCWVSSTSTSSLRWVAGWLGGWVWLWCCGAVVLWQQRCRRSSLPRRRSTHQPSLSHPFPAQVHDGRPATLAELAGVEEDLSAGAMQADVVATNQRPLDLQLLEVGG